MGLESSNARMANLARQEMYFHEFITVEEIIARIGEVNAAQVQTMAQRLFDPARIAVTLLGRLDGVKLSRTSASRQLLVPHRLRRPTKNETGCPTFAAYLFLWLRWDRELILCFVELAFLFSCQAHRWYTERLERTVAFPAHGPGSSPRSIHRIEVEDHAGTERKQELYRHQPAPEDRPGRDAQGRRHHGRDERRAGAHCRRGRRHLGHGSRARAGHDPRRGRRGPHGQAQPHQADHPGRFDSGHGQGPHRPLRRGADSARARRRLHRRERSPDPRRRGPPHRQARLHHALCLRRAQPGRGPAAHRRGRGHDPHQR